MILRLAPLGLAQDRPCRRAALGRACALAFILLGPLVACGKKGPPLAPLRLVPDAVADVSARRAEDQVRLRFSLPNKNANGPGAVNLDKVEVFAATIAPGAIVPPNRELLVPKFVVGTIPVKPVSDETETPAEGQPPAPPDTRPAPGDVALFVEQLTADKLQPQFTTMPPEPTAEEAAAAAAAEETKAKAAAEPAPLMRIYVIRGVTRGGRAGQASSRIQIPLTPAPAPPVDVKATFTSAAVNLTWLAPVPALESAAPVTFNVYAKDGIEPLNPKPLTEASFERAGVEFGKEECFTVRSAVQSGMATIESAPSEARCVTPSDVFPPAEPKGLSAVASAGAINLIWDANTEPDLAGYVVLRGETPGEKLQPVTPTPIQATTYRDTTVTPGVRYVYVVVAVDRATPPNVSGQSMRVEETAR